MLQLTVERQKKGWSIAELARQTGRLHSSTVGQIENGYIGRPLPSQLIALAVALDWPQDRADELVAEVPNDACA